jgi:hypothetical protein
VAGSMTVAGTTTIENVNISNTTIVTSELIMAPAVNTQVINAGTSNTLTFISNNITGMTLTTGGYLGIGTSNPLFALDVTGTIRSNGANAQLRFYDQTYYGTDYWYWYSSSDVLKLNKQISGAPSNGDVLFIDSSGNLGLGVVPSAWYSSAKTLQVGTGSQFSVLNFSSTSSALVNNLYYSGSSYVFQNNGYAGIYDFNNNVAGGYTWRVSNSGTAGGNPGLTQVMTLNNSGQLLIGTTTAQEKLTVNGNINLSGSIYQSSGSFTCPHGGPAVTFTISGLRDLQRYLVGAWYGDYGNCLGCGMWLVECLNGSSIAAVTTLNTVNYNGSLGYVNGQTYGGAGAGSYSAGNGDQMQLVFYQNGTGVSTAQPCYYFVLQLA